MNNRILSEQEEFWKGDFGDQYNIRVSGDEIVRNNIYLFSNIFKNLENPIKSVLEFGANIGLNIEALRSIDRKLKISAIEINAKAVEKLKKIRLEKLYHSSILDFNLDYKRDLVFTKGVLIHINPDQLKNVYRKLYESTNKYILIIEFYNPYPVETNYRGNKNKQFKRDFAGEIMDTYSDVSLINYGFIYRRDNIYPMDDLSWFLLKKN